MAPVYSRLDELDAPPVVGERYLVPCIVVARASGGTSLIPTLGPVHEDRSFAPLLGKHYHYDPRFLDLSIVQLSIPGMTPEQVALVIAHKSGPQDTIVYAEMTCLRTMPQWPTGTVATDAAPWIPGLATTHRKCRVAADGRCPHAGTDGRSFPRDADGAWTCIHGLKWKPDGSLSE